VTGSKEMVISVRKGGNRPVRPYFALDHTSFLYLTTSSSLQIYLSDHLPLSVSLFLYLTVCLSLVRRAQIVFLPSHYMSSCLTLS